MPISPSFTCRALATFTLLLYTLLVSASAFADPSGRIGRVAWVSGTLELSNQKTGEAFETLVNQPLTRGDLLTTHSGSRAEIQIGSTTLRLDANTRLVFDRLDDEQTRVFLERGRVIVRLASDEAAREFGLETHSGHFDPRSTGLYRFESFPDSTEATSYSGRLSFASIDSGLEIEPGLSARIWHSSRTRSRLSAAVNDDFSLWSAERERSTASNLYSRYVSPEMTGAGDLDQHGHWSETPEYGAVWYPRNLAADWAPFRHGRWVWVESWGWNWVGYEPWGFAPFHYGRWVRHHGAWGWVPGVRVVRPVYAPAMVGWIGTPCIGVAVSFGTVPSVGWFPLAPREIYVPFHRSSTTYVRNVNITHVTQITNVTEIVSNPHAAVRGSRYAHRDTPQAVTAAPPDTFSRQRPGASSGHAPGERPGQRNPTHSAQPQVSVLPIDIPHGKERTNRPEATANVYPRRERMESAPLPAPVPPASRPNAPAPPMVAVPHTPPAASGVSLPKTERPTPESVRPVAIEARPDTPPQNAAERPERREEQTMRRPPDEWRTRGVAQPRLQTPPARQNEVSVPAMREAPRNPTREAGRPPEARSETRVLRPEERAGPPRGDHDGKRHRQSDREKR